MVCILFSGKAHQKVALSNSSAISSVMEDQNGHCVRCCPEKIIVQDKSSKIDEVKDLPVMSDPYMLSAASIPRRSLLELRKTFLYAN